jgi:hypothetical protein
MDCRRSHFFYISLSIILDKRYIIVNKLGYHAVAYCLAIHLLNSIIGFLSPLEDPEDEDFVVRGGEDSSFLPTRDTEEFRPFQRKLKEFTFW